MKNKYIFCLLFITFLITPLLSYADTYSENELLLKVINEENLKNQDIKNDIERIKLEIELTTLRNQLKELNQQNNNKYPTSNSNVTSNAASNVLNNVNQGIIMGNPNTIPIMIYEY